MPQELALFFVPLSEGGFRGIAGKEERTTKKNPGFTRDLLFMIL